MNQRNKECIIISSFKGGFILLIILITNLNKVTFELPINPITYLNKGSRKRHIIHIYHLLVKQKKPIIKGLLIAI